MNNEMSILQQGAAGLPAHLQQYSEHASSAASMVTGFNSLPKISLRGKQFRFVKDDKEFAYPMGQPFNCIILAADPEQGVAKAWYEKSYTNPDEAGVPDCFSADGKRPDPNSESAQFQGCAQCPKNMFGSGTDAQGNPSKGKACSDYKNLFVVESDKLDDPISVIRVPATSLKNLSAYGRDVARNNIPTFALVTQLSFTDAEYPQLEFKALSFLSEGDTARI